MTPPVTPPSTTLYFPPTSGTTWETTTPASLGWNETELNNLYTYLQQKNTKAFIILKNGKIVAEKYYGTFTADSNWYWASAGKTMTGMLVGIAQKEGLLSINDKTSKFLGNGWTSLPQAKEDLITIKNQLTMTTGLDDNVQPDNDCTSPACLQYKADAGTRWSYHNAPYTLLDKVVETATGKSYNAYFQEKIRDRIGMNGAWIKTGYNNVYYSNPRSMARFGLLMLNKGKWDQTSILSDSTYFNAQTKTSQSFNLSYGYLNLAEWQIQLYVTNTAGRIPRHDGSQCTSGYVFRTGQERPESICGSFSATGGDTGWEILRGMCSWPYRVLIMSCGDISRRSLSTNLTARKQRARRLDFMKM